MDLIAKVLIGSAALFLSLSDSTAGAQIPSPPQKVAITVEGTVRNAAGEAIPDAVVFLEGKNQSNPAETKTKTDGTFVLSAFGPGTFTLWAEKSGWRKSDSSLLILAAEDKKRVDLVLEPLAAAHSDSSGASSTSKTPLPAMEFDDKPNFTVAGVTDWNNAGMHGSDVTARTSEALAKETLTLKNDKVTGNSGADNKLAANSPSSSRQSMEQVRAAREQAWKMLATKDTADVHRLLGELDERLGDPLEAVREYERAARMDPSEQNYFEWGTELLLHKADQPAVEVFTKGSRIHPDSARMLAGLGAALYASGSYEEAAHRICEASDLQPRDSAPYLFLGKMQRSATALLPCTEEKLARFVREQPENAWANYYYGLTLWKRDRASENSAGLQQAEALLEKAAAIDPKLGEVYLQLGILHFGRGGFEKAIRDYKKAIEVSPQLTEPHYRLGLAYRRMGEESKAEQEFRVYQQMEKAETAAMESQRRELRQFMIILKDQPAPPAPH
jgi:tetratricopeptide (TPR) repeat protein